ncbi:hypothetical protein I3F58_08860 [Streptomyces sp. MUM 203J]|uniref:hypothetical protein n=1 Tax=Streptomyces sp. MUM 203J TaxID=2791990 RepID=UPI001F04003C|nr:hypothetical protein [Streptomyces sp. MUM 203J]MCH0539675.1 hypothetical protein [Streptomyces sp. MUM 203J]
MSVGWAAGVTRAKSMAVRRVGAATAGELAAADGMGEALRGLRGTWYVRGTGADPALVEAQRAVGAGLLWQLRVLAGWQPRAGAQAIRLLAAGFEIANTEDRLRVMAGTDGTGGAPLPPYRLGSLAVVWPRLSGAATPGDLRAVLASSPWGDPGAESPAAVAVGMRVSALARVAGGVPAAARWAAGRLALLVARQLFVAGVLLPPGAVGRAERVLGRAPVTAGSLDGFRRSLPARARWALDGVSTVDELWRAEARWWETLDSEGAALLRSPRLGVEPVVGAVAVLSADAWRVRGALSLAARGRRNPEDPGDPG